MDRSSYDRITKILTRVLEAPPELRVQVMETSCGEDRSLLASVRQMLALAESEEGMFSDESVAKQRAELDHLIDDVQSETSDWIPERIGSYVIEEVIGRGGTGVVFKARQERPSRYVAIKLLHPAYASQKTMARLAREAEFLGTLQHIGIAQIFEAGVFDAGAGEQPFLVMEWLRGRDLLEHAEAEKLDARARVELFSRVVEAVSHAHEKGITHRDLKPDNILVAQETARPKLLDFGIAAMAERTSGAGATVEGDLLGTVAYMAPEQARRSLGSVGPHTDVYSLGAIAFELLAHRPLRQMAGLTITQALSEVAEREAPRLDARGMGLPRDLTTIVEKALELSPGDRYASATELGADLRRFQDGRPILARPPSWVDRSVKFTKRHRALMAGVAATTIMFMVGLGATLFQARLAGLAEDAATRELYAAQMVLATSDVDDPATSSRIAAVVDRWREESMATTTSGRPGWEWLLLDSVRRDRVVELKVAHDPLPIAWDPGGTRIAVGFQSAMAVYDSATGDELAYLELSERGSPSTLLTGITWDSFRPDRVIGTGVGIIAAWDVGSRKCAWKVRTEFSAAAAAIPDGRVLAFDEKGALNAHNGDTGELLATWPGPYIATISLELHRESERLLLAPKDCSSYVLDLKSMQPLPGQSRSSGYLGSIRWHPDGRRFAASFPGKVLAMQVDPGKVLFELNVHKEKTFSVDWSADGSLLATASEDRTVRIYSGDTGRLLNSFVGHHRVVRDARFCPKGRRVASVGASGKVLVWDPLELDAVRVWQPEVPVPQAMRPHLAWKPQSRFFVAMNRKHLLKWDVEAESHTVLEGAYISSDGEWIFVHGGAGTHEIRHRAGRVARRFDNPTFDTFLTGAWHPTQPHFLAAVYGGVYLFRMEDASESQPRRIGPQDAQVGHVKWSCDGTSAAIATLAGTVRGLRVPSGETLFEFELESPIGVESFDWSPDGSWIVIGCSTGNLRIRSARGDDVNGSTERLLKGHSREVDGLAWHPDGTRIASASRDGTVKLWDPITGHIMASFECVGRPTDVVWTQGGKALVAVDAEGRLYTFDASRGIRRWEGGAR